MFNKNINHRGEELFDIVKISEKLSILSHKWSIIHLFEFEIDMIYHGKCVPQGKIDWIAKTINAKSYTMSYFGRGRSNPSWHIDFYTHKRGTYAVK